ncbi:hypothetical protein VCRA2118O236_800002 [Vibrio crassostreae]|nr:hypothetical protein VCRA2118O236_800002 [Vibrio crassostreae]
MTPHKRKVPLMVILLHEKLVNKKQTETLSTIFFHTLNYDILYVKLKV